MLPSGALAASSLASAEMATHFSCTVGAGGKINDREPRGGRGQHGAGRRHAVEEPEDFEFGFELVRYAIDHQVGIADSVFDGGDEGYRRGFALQLCALTIDGKKRLSWPGPSCWRRYSWAWCRLAGITSSRRTQ